MILCFSSDVIPFLSIIISIVSLAWAIVANSKAYTLVKYPQSQPAKTVCSTVVHFIQSTLCMLLWRFCTVGSRVIVFALVLRVGLQAFSHSVLYGTIITISAILLVLAPAILLYGLCTGTSFLSWFAGLMEIFISSLDFSKHGLLVHYLSPDDYLHRLIVRNYQSRKQMSAYYCVVFITTVVMVITWYVMLPIKDDHTVTMLLVLALLLFILGIVFMIVHYTCCHHNREDIRKWIPCNDLQLNMYETYTIKWRVAILCVSVFLILIAAVVLRVFFPW